MVGWHHRLNGHEFEQASGDGEGQGACHAAVNEVNKESDTTERQQVFRACYVEWSQSENEKYCILTHIHVESRKMVLMYLFAGQQWRRTQVDREQTWGHSWGRREWDKLRQQHSNIQITIFKIDSQCQFAFWCRELKSGALWQPRGVAAGRKV